MRTRLLAAVATLATALALWPAAAGASQPETIGRSVQGRPILAWHLEGAARDGGGERARILVVGVIHGNEPAGLGVTRRLLRAGAPAGSELWLVPTVNPDGLALGTRGNARGVDLNRNFPFDWAPLGGGEYSGTGPLSEPESHAALGLISRIRPDVTIWFHQPFGMVDRPLGDARVARRFAQLAGLPFYRLPGRYPGSASRWQNHVLPASIAFVVEFPQLAPAPLLSRAARAVRTVAAELGSPSVGTALTLGTG